VTNALYFGDNLDVLRRQDYVPNSSVDLIYLDPPFNSQTQFNLVFDRPAQGHRSAAQAGAFVDTWVWGEEAELAYRDLMQIGFTVGRLIDALRSAFRESPMMAYIVMMAVRLRELHLKLKPTGSIYLHCDPSASHYLKVLMDAIFGNGHYLNEIVWLRTNAHNLKSRMWPRQHDTILVYSRGETFTLNPVYQPYGAAQLKRYKPDENGRLCTGRDLTVSLVRRLRQFEWRGTKPPPHRSWGASEERLEQWYADGRILLKKDGAPRLDGLKVYLDEEKGKQVGTVWTDIHRVKNTSGERLSYPTQKPLALLERIIEAATKPGDVILDPFCGCGTTIEAAQRLGRKWIGIDVAVHAIKVIEARLAERFDGLEYKIEGMPRDFTMAEELAARDKYQFQWWANYLFNPHALREQKKGADRGIDGELFFPNGPGRAWGKMLTSVKGGNVGPAMVRDFRGVLTREKAEMGLFICLRRPTPAMLTEAATAGIADTVHGDLPKLQIVSIEEWFEGKVPRLPPLEHLPSAALARTVRRQALALQDAKAPQMLLPIGEGADKDFTRHINPQMMTPESLAEDAKRAS
jgi:adenine specific DNA methylase Mod